MTETLTERDETYLNALRHRITLLKQELYDAKAAHIGDLDSISKALNELAEDLNWCNEYATFLRDLDNLLHGELTLPKMEYEVYYTVTFSLSKTVTANNEDEAWEIVEEGFSTHDLHYEDYEIDHNRTEEAQ